VSAGTLGRANCRVHVRKEAVGDCWGQLAGASMALDRILVHQSEGRRIPLEPAEIFYLEADDFQTVIRQRGKRLLRDSRGLGQLSSLGTRLSLLASMAGNCVSNHPSTESFRSAARMKHGFGKRLGSKSRGGVREQVPISTSLRLDYQASHLVSDGHKKARGDTKRSTRYQR
jgi:hypothetical protein